MKFITTLGASKANSWYYTQIEQSQDELNVIAESRQKLSFLSILIGKFTFFKKADDIETSGYYHASPYVSLFDIMLAEKHTYSRNGFRDRQLHLSAADLITWYHNFDQDAQNHERRLTRRIKNLKGLIKQNIVLIFRYNVQFNFSTSAFIKFCSERISDKSGNEDNSLAPKTKVLNVFSNYLKSLQNESDRTKKFNTKYRQSS